MPRRQLRRASLFVLAACGLFASPAAAPAQDFAIDGIVVGADGAPVAGATVLLHRVTQSGGAMLGDTVTGENGRFVLRPAPGTPLDGVFFVASRYQGELYVGPMVRAPFTPGVDYVLRVGVPETSVARALEATPPPPAANSAPPSGGPSRGAAFAIAALALTGAALLALARHRGAPSEQRRLLIRIAELDERYAGAADPPEHYRTERSRLVRRRLDLSR